MGNVMMKCDVDPGFMVLVLVSLATTCVGNAILHSYHAIFGHFCSSKCCTLLYYIADCIADMDKMVIVGDNNFGEQKSHHRCRRKKHDVRMLDALR